MYFYMACLHNLEIYEIEKAIGNNEGFKKKILDG